MRGETLLELTFETCLDSLQRFQPILETSPLLSPVCSLTKSGQNCPTSEQEMPLSHQFPTHFNMFLCSPPSCPPSLVWKTSRPPSSTRCPRPLQPPGPTPPPAPPPLPRPPLPLGVVEVPRRRLRPYPRQLPAPKTPVRRRGGAVGHRSHPHRLPLVGGLLVGG